MIDRNYKYLKFKRTYTGGSKEKELEIFKYVQNIDGEGTCDWIEYRRILFPYLEDVMHTNFSRSLISKRLSFIFMGFSFFLGLFHFIALSIIILLLSILCRILFIFFNKKIRETLSSYNMSVDIVKTEIKNLIGLDI